MAKTRVAINGFGRIGRNAFKIAFDRSDIEVVAINDLADAKTLAHLLKHDSNYGAYQHEVKTDGQNIIVKGVPVRALSEKDPGALPWKELNIDVVIECSGDFTESKEAQAHIAAGAKKVVLSAPSKGNNATTVVLGVNEDKLESSGDIVSCACPTTNCVAPIAAVIESTFGIEKSMITTVHSYTGSQRLLDAPANSLREARNAATNLVPMASEALTTAGLVLPVLQGSIGGLSVHVPTAVVSLCDAVFITKRTIGVDEVNDVFKKLAAEPYYQGILAVTDEELVSSDFIGNSHSAIVDLKLTAVSGGNMLKVVAWYDNEWGYCNRMVEVVADVGNMLRGK